MVLAGGTGNPPPIIVVQIRVQKGVQRGNPANPGGQDRPRGGFFVVNRALKVVVP